MSYHLIVHRDKGLPPGKKPAAEGGKLGLRKPPGPVDKTPPVKKLGLQPNPQVRNVI